jgi:glycosyltransferase involved in cell wall biosynthesis
MTIGGNVVIRNGNELEYCWREAIQSLLPVCDMVSVCDGESTDGTQEEIREWAKREPKIVLCVWPWPSPKGDGDWFANFINYNREHIPCDYQFQLDADEIVHEKSYDFIREFAKGAYEPQRTLVCHRYNFWRDPQHLIPHGVCCGHKVIRIAPQDIFLASDGYDRRGEYPPRIARNSPIEIMHYGFLRKPAAYFKKARAIQEYYVNSYDSRMEAAEKFEGNWATMPGVCGGWEANPIPFEGTHAKLGIEWLKTQGYQL